MQHRMQSMVCGSQPPDAIAESIRVRYVRALQNVCEQVLAGWSCRPASVRRGVAKRLPPAAVGRVSGGSYPAGAVYLSHWSTCHGPNMGLN
eukprot:6668232-Prymnesium_polylepis.1